MKVLEYDFGHSAVLWRFIFCQRHFGLLLVSAFSSQTLSFEGYLYVHSDLGNFLRKSKSIYLKK